MRDPKAARTRSGSAQAGAVSALGPARSLAGRVRRTGARSTSRRCRGIEDDLADRDFTINAIAERVGSDELRDPFGGLPRPRPAPHPCGARQRLRGRPAPAVAGGPARGPARLQDRPGDRGARSAATRTRHPASRGAHPRRARQLSARALPPPRRLWSARAARRRPRPSRPLGLAGLPPGRGLRRVAAPVARLERAEALRRCAAERRAAASFTRARSIVSAARPSRGRPTRSPSAAASELAPAIEDAREDDPAEPLLRGDELGLPPGPEIGRLLAEIEEERAAGTIATRDEALELCTTPCTSASRRRPSGSPRWRTRARRSSSRSSPLPRSEGRRAGARSGSGTGALAFALAPHVREVVGSTWSRSCSSRGGAGPRASRTSPSSRATRPSLPYDLGPFDLTGCVRTLHHVARPELVVAELVRVTRPGGRMLVVDQIAPVDPSGRVRAEPLRAGTRPVAPRGRSRTST